jgi:peptidyl-prolyl cis-trans isomerase D
MLSFFRRIINSKVGIIITFVVLGVIALAFGLGDVTGMHSGGGVLSGDSVATVGNDAISSTELRNRTQNELEGARQQQPTLDMVSFVNGGGLEGTLERIINTSALEQYGKQQGLVVSKRLVDGRIASLPQLQGPDGKFSQTAYDQLLRQEKMTDKQIRDDFARDLITQSLIAPTLGASQVPANLALPYASLLLEKRQGTIGFVPTTAMGQGTPPTDAELGTFYQRNIAHYTVPERRIIRVAVTTADQIKAASTPTDAEVAKAYQAQQAKFLPTEKRTLTQVVLPDQAAATAFAAKIKAGTSIDEAARAAGFEPNKLTGIEKTAYAGQNTPDLANAVFGAAKGSVVGPIRSALGFTVVHVEAIEQVAGKSLEQAKPELVKALAADKAAVAMTNLHDAIDDAISNKATFDEVVKDHKMTTQVTKPLLSSGVDPDDAASKPDPLMAQAVAAAFAAEEGDNPQLVPYGQDGSFAVVSLSKIVPAAPRPLAQIREGVAHDFVIDRAQRAARQAARDAVDRINKGMPLAQSLAATKLTLPAAKPVDFARGQIIGNPQVPPPLALLFSMSARTAKLLEAPNKGGWYVIYLDKITPGNAAGHQAEVSRTRDELAKLSGREYVAQFGEAVRRAVGVKKNTKAIADLKASLTGQGGSN